MSSRCVKKLKRDTSRTHIVPSNYDATASVIMREAANPQHRSQAPKGTGPKELPFMQLAKKFENLREDQCSVSRKDQEVSEAHQNTYQLLKVHNERILPIMEALFPRDVVEEHKAALASGVEGLISHRTVYKYLCLVMATSHSNDSFAVTRWSLLIGHPTAKSMAETFFLCAIEAGNLEVARHLILSPETSIDVNEQICVVDGTKYTSVELAAALHHVPLTRLLVELRADVNKSCDNGNKNKHPSGALNWALSRCYKSKDVSLELVKCLLDAGGSVSVDTLERTFQRGLSTIVQAIVDSCIGACHQTWNERSIFHQIVHYMDRTTVWATVRSMYTTGASLIHKLGVWRSTYEGAPYPTAIIDVATQRGDLELVRLLKMYKVPWTDDTLTAAIRSRNTDLVSYILEDNSVAHGYSPHYRSTPYAEAIRCGASNIARLLLERGCMDQLQDRSIFCATLAAASEIGDYTLVKSLLKLPLGNEPAVLARALTQAVSANQTDTALLLLNAGASKDGECFNDLFGFTCADDASAFEQYRSTHLLSTACRNRNAKIVQALLNHDADVLDDSWDNALDEAVEWADHLMFKSFIPIGIARSSRAVSIAVKKKDYEVVRLLLQSGVVPCAGSLGKAVYNNDELMVRELLNYGASPVDRYVLSTASYYAPALFSLLIQETRKRYPRGTSQCSMAIWDAVKMGRIEIVQTLLQCLGGNQLLRIEEDKEASSPLAAAIRKDGGTDLRMVEVFLNHGFELDDVVVTNSRKTMSGSMLPHETSLLVAIGTKQVKMVRLLLAWGASVNLPAERGLKRTPLQKAAELGSMPIVELLLNQAADVNAPPAARGGGTAVQLAAISGSIAMVQLLCSYGAEVTAPGSKVYGRSAIEGAAEHDRSDMVKHLLDFGPQIASQLEGAIGLAKAQGYHGIVEMLEPVLRNTNCLAQYRAHGTGPEIRQFYLPEAPAISFANDAVLAQSSVAGPVQDAFTSLLPFASTNGQQLVCHRCSGSFSKASSLKRHQDTVHAAPDQLGEFKCPICQDSFTRQDSMKRHQVKHDPSRKVQCATCSGKFRKDYLSTHSCRNGDRVC